MMFMNTDQLLCILTKSTKSICISAYDKDSDADDDHGDHDDNDDDDNDYDDDDDNVEENLHQLLCILTKSTKSGCVSDQQNGADDRTHNCRHLIYHYYHGDFNYSDYDFDYDFEYDDYDN